MDFEAAIHGCADQFRYLITIFGGSGFLGRHVVRALAKRRYGFASPCAARTGRSPAAAGYCWAIAAVQAICAARARSRRRYGADIVLVTVEGILFERGRPAVSKTVQRFGAEQVALAAAAYGARVIHVSAIGANEHSTSLYAQSKAKGEHAVRTASPDAMIVRPSIVFRPEDDFFNRFGADGTHASVPAAGR